MGLFSRSRDKPFWVVAPQRNSDAAGLHQHGVACIVSGDGKGAISTGWALWKAYGLHVNQAADFLTDGYAAWRDGPGFDRDQASAFLQECLVGLAANPELQGSPWDLPQEIVAPIATHYSTRCYLASELLALYTGDPPVEVTTRAFSAIVSAPREFVPPRSMDWAEAHARLSGSPAPWS